MLIFVFLAIDDEFLFSPVRDGVLLLSLFEEGRPTFDGVLRDDLDGRSSSVSSL